MSDADLTPTARLHDLADRYWSAVLDRDPTAATFYGHHDRDHLIGDLSAAADAAHREVLEGLRVEAAGIHADSLDEAGRITRSLLLHELESGIAMIDARFVEMACDQMLGPHAELLMVAPQLTYPEPAHAEAALERYAGVGRFLDGALDRFRAGLASGRSPAACAVERSLNSLTGYLEGPVEEDPFLLAGIPEGWDGAEAWRERALDLIGSVIRPAFERYRTALAEEVLPASRPDDRPGLCHLPDGDALYRTLIRHHTTLDLSPEEIHARGLAELDRLDAEYLEIGGRHFGDGPGTVPLEEVLRRLREDQSLKFHSAEEIVQVAEDALSRAMAVMDGTFGRLPQAPCVVTPIPEFLAADAPTAYYFPPAPDGSRPGTYFIKTIDPTHTSRAEAESIAFHEAIPGHHLQIAIAQELEGLPEFQRHVGATSYIEGWGLYAERLAEEMGLYTDDVARLGMLAADSWRSARLVVDTGLHAMGWTRQQAIELFEQRTPVPMAEVLPEVDRYIAMPGQALAYKLGQQELIRLREEARARLGEGFSLPRFHDTVLGSGAVTLPVLRDMVAALS